MLLSYIQSKLNPEKPLWEIKKAADLELYEVCLYGYRITACSTLEKAMESCRYYNSYLFGNFPRKEVQADANL